MEKQNRLSGTAKFLRERYQPIDFFSAVFLGENERVKELIVVHPELVNHTRPQHGREVGFSGLHYAISRSYANILKLLIKHGTKPTNPCQWLVKFALWRGEIEMLQVLLEAGIVPKRLKWEPIIT